MNDLVLCPSCTRHVRRAEPRCPFCGTALADELRRAAPRVAPPGLSRARLYAFHAAVATTVAAGACGGTTRTTDDGGTVVDAPAGDARGSADASGDAAQDAPGDAQTTVDAAADGAIVDAGADRDGWGPPPPPYGCVFPEGCGDAKV